MSKLLLRLDALPILLASDVEIRMAQILAPARASQAPPTLEIAAAETRTLVSGETMALAGFLGRRMPDTTDPLVETAPVLLQGRPGQLPVVLGSLAIEWLRCGQAMREAHCTALLPYSLVIVRMVLVLGIWIQVELRIAREPEARVARLAQVHPISGAVLITHCGPMSALTLKWNARARLGPGIILALVMGMALHAHLRIVLETLRLVVASGRNSYQPAFAVLASALIWVASKRQPAHSRGWVYFFVRREMITIIAHGA